MKSYFESLPETAGSSASISPVQLPTRGCLSSFAAWQLQPLCFTTAAVCSNHIKAQYTLSHRKMPLHNTLRQGALLFTTDGKTKHALKWFKLGKNLPISDCHTIHFLGLVCRPSSGSSWKGTPLVNGKLLLKRRTSVPKAYRAAAARHGRPEAADLTPLRRPGRSTQKAGLQDEDQSVFPKRLLGTSAPCPAAWPAALRPSPLTSHGPASPAKREHLSARGTFSSSS